jgi:hypothetical protein
VKLFAGMSYEISAEMVCHIWGDNWQGPGKIFHTDTITIPADATNVDQIKLVLDADSCPPGHVGGPPPWEH